MHLSRVMIAMQSVYLVCDPDVVSSAVCAVMGALLHFFTLAVFLWMSVIAHRTQKTFSALVSNSLIVHFRNSEALCSIYDGFNSSIS